MLFYINSISKLGQIWEISQIDDNKKLITKYNLIKNIPLGCMKDIEPNLNYELVNYESLYKIEIDKINESRNKMDFC